MKEICCIFGAGEYGFFPTLDSGAFIIAADAGFDYLVKNGIQPDLTVGDFDSLGTVPDCGEVIQLPVRKDDTDMMFSVREGLRRGFRTFYIYGGLGGNLDHTLANIQTLSFIAAHGGIGFLIGKNEDVCVLHEKSLTFGKEHTGRLSVFSFGDSASGIYERGFGYGLEDAVLTKDVPLGVSNYFTGNTAVLSVRMGDVVAVWTHGDLFGMPVVGGAV